MLSGGTGFKMVPELELYACVCSSILTPQYYTPNTNDQINKIKTLIRKVDPVFVAQLAVYAREQMYLRTIPLVLTVELAKCHSGDNLLRRMAGRVIQRADEITELLAYYVKANNLRPKFVEAKGGHSVEKKIYKLSNQLRKGVADAFFKFDEYQFAKYNRPGEIKLRDALFLTHPKPRTDAQRVLFEKIAQDNLSTPYTWETQMSKAGQDGKDKKAVWEELIQSGKLGYMALLRNLRNFLDAGVSEVWLNKVADRIANPDEVRKSKQFPFRFLSAYRSIGGGPRTRYTSYWGDYDSQIGQHENLFTPILLESLEKAAKISVENIPMLINQAILVASDVSGSMQSPLSEKSSLQQFDIGALLGLLVQARADNSVFGMFGDTWKPLTSEKVDNPLAATNELHRREGEVGYSTHGYKVLQWAINQKKKFSRIMIFTDCQMYGSGHDGRNIDKLWKQYKTINPYAKLYLFNLSSYGQTPIDLRAGDVALITGWSDKIFTAMDNIERGGEVLDMVKEIQI